MIYKKYFLLFIVVAFQANNFALALINIDTTFEAAVPGQVNEAFIFETQQTFTNLDYARGSVEFRKGLLPAIYNGTMDLSVTPPLSGAIDAGQQGFDVFGYDSIMNYRTFSDLTLGKITFTGLPVPWVIRFAFGAPATIFLTSDLTVSGTFPGGGGLQLGFNTFQAEGTVDGQGNRVVVSPGSGMGVDLAFPINFKDISFLFNGSGVGGGLFGGDIRMRNIEIVSKVGQIAILANANFTFIGSHNIFGYNGNIVFFNNNITGVNFIIDAQSRVTVAPGTVLTLGVGSAYIPPYVTFTDATSELYLDNCSIDFTPPGNQTLVLTKGTIYINGNVTFKSTTAQGSYQFGDGIDPLNNMNIIILPGSKLIIDDGVTLINANA